MPHLSALPKLCAAACERDCEAFNELFEDMRRYLYSILNRILRESWKRAWRDDLLQEWRTELWTKPETTVCKAAKLDCDRARALLGSIVKHKAIDFLRRQERILAKETELTENSLPPFTNDDAYDKLEFLKARLSDFDWLVVQLGRSGMTHAEIAASPEVLKMNLEVTVGVISGVFRRIREFAKEFYEPNK